MTPKKIFCLLLCLCLCLCFVPKRNASADATTLTQIAGLSYALGNWMGLSFNWSNGLDTQSKSFFERKVDSYLAGRTIGEVFGSEVARVVAGDLYIPYQMYNGIHDFLTNLIQTEGITDNTSIGGMVGDLDFGSDTSQNRSFGTATWDVWQTSGGVPKRYYWNGQAYNNGTAYGRDVRTEPIAYAATSIVSEVVEYSEGLRVRVRYYFNASRIDSFVMYLPSQVGNVATVTATADNFSETVLNPDKEWTGNIGGAAPDTNLDQLVDQIFDDVADNNLTVEGEVIDVPIPPEPAPTPVTDILDGINTQIGQLDGLGNDIGDISDHLDDLGETQGQIADSAQDAAETLEGISEQVGSISGAINQAVSDIADAIGEQTSTLSESASATATAAEAIAEAVEDEDIDWRKFDLRGLFPFCIPFDIYNMLQALAADPVAPRVQVPFVIQSLGFNYNVDIEL